MDATVDSRERTASREARGAPPGSQELDGLRGLSALTVMAGHAAVLPFAETLPALVQAAGLLGRVAVIVFFVLSGHVIVKSIIAMRSRGGFSPVVYAVNRLARVYPPYLLCLCLAWLVVWLRMRGAIEPQPRLMAEPMAATAASFLRDLIFLFGSGTPVQNANAPVWSLRIEVVCYVAAGLLATALQAGRLVAIALAAAAAALLLAAGLRLESALLGFAAFGLGALTAIFPVRPPLGAPAAALAVLLAAAVMLFQHGGLGAAAPLLRLAYEAAAVAAAALVVASLAAGAGGAVARSLRHAAWLAPFSYTLFITHLPLIIVLGSILPVSGGVAAQAASYAVLLAAPFVFAMIAARVVERQTDIRRWILARISLR